MAKFVKKRSIKAGLPPGTLIHIGERGIFAHSKIYGMNFQYMPEIPWRWGYPAVLLVMAAVGISMVVYFRRKKWL